jgi:transposase
MQQDVVTVRVDLAKNVFQVHAIGADGNVLVRRQLPRAELLKFVSALPPCLVGMEACASAHHWGPELIALGHEVWLMPPAYVKPYVKRGKTDASRRLATIPGIGPITASAIAAVPDATMFRLGRQFAACSASRRDRTARAVRRSSAVSVSRATAIYAASSWLAQRR